MNSNSISLYFVDYDRVCWPVCLENDTCDKCSIQDFTFEDLMNCPGS